MVWHSMVWYGMVWWYMVCYGITWRSMVWYGLVWNSMVPYQTISYHNISSYCLPYHIIRLDWIVVWLALPTHAPRVRGSIVWPLVLEINLSACPVKARKVHCASSCVGHTYSPIKRVVSVPTLPSTATRPTPQNQNHLVWITTGWWL